MELTKVLEEYLIFLNELPIEKQEYYLLKLKDLCLSYNYDLLCKVQYKNKLIFKSVYLRYISTPQER